MKPSNVEERHAQQEKSLTAERTGRGFASLDPERHRKIASAGGKAAHEKGVAHEFDAEEAREAGRKGGEAVAKKEGHMAQIGRKGGEATSGDREHMAQIGSKGGNALVNKRRSVRASGGAP